MTPIANNVTNTMLAKFLIYYKLEQENTLQGICQLCSTSSTLPANWTFGGLKM